MLNRSAVTEAPPASKSPVSVLACAKSVRMISALHSSGDISSAAAAKEIGLLVPISHLKPWPTLSGDRIAVS